MNKLGFSEEEVELMSFYKFQLLYERYKQVFNFEKSYKYVLEKPEDDAPVVEEIVSF